MDFERTLDKGDSAGESKQRFVLLKLIINVFKFHGPDELPWNIMRRNTAD